MKQTWPILDFCFDTLYMYIDISTGQLKVYHIWFVELLHNFPSNYFQNEGQRLSIWVQFLSNLTGKWNMIFQFTEKLYLFYQKLVWQCTYHLLHVLFTSSS